MRTDVLKTCLGTLVTLWVVVASVGAVEELPTEQIANGVQVVRGAVNGVLLQRDGKDPGSLR